MRIDLLLGLMVLALVIMMVAKLARDLLLRRQGYAVNDLVVEKRSVGAAISQAGYMIGVMLGFLGAITAANRGTGVLSLFGHVALSGAVAIALQLTADWISDKLIFRGVGGQRGAVVDDVNVALAVGKAAVSIATGLVLRGSMVDPTAGILVCVAWFVVGQALMVAAVLLYCRITPYDDLAEIKNNNLAAGFPIAGILLALGLVVEAAIATRVMATEGSALQSALHVGKFLGVSLVLVYVFRFVTAFVLLPKVKLTRAIVEHRSVGAGLQEGVSFLLVSLIVTFFLT